MKPRNSTPFRSHASVSAILPLCLLLSAGAQAKVITWDGGYPTTGVWNNAQNWEGDVNFANGDTVLIGPNCKSNYIGVNRSVKSITYLSTCNAAFNTSFSASGSASGGTQRSFTFNATNTGITIEAGSTFSHSLGNAANHGIANVILQNDLTVTHHGTNSYRILRPITGASFGLIKDGTGLLVLSAANTYDGATTINLGEVRGTTGGSSANSEVIINSETAVSGVSVTDNTQTWTCNALTANAAGTLRFTFGAVAPSTSVAPLTVTGLADFTTATPAVDITVTTALTPGTYPLMTWGSINGDPTTAGVTVSEVLAGTTTNLSVSDNTLNLVVASSASAVVKANNTTNLNVGSSWVGGAVPGTGDVARWDNTVTSANTTVLGSDITWGGISIEDPAGPVTIDPGNTLTLGEAVLDLNLSNATADLTLNCPLTLGAEHIWDVAASRTLTLGGVISGAFPIIKQGDGTAILSAANTYTGNTSVSAGTLQLAASEVIPDGVGTGNISLDGTLDLNANSETLNGLSGAGVIDNTGVTTSALSVGTNDQSGAFNGVIQSTTGNINLTKTGAGTQTLGGANTFNGTVTISGGTLAVGNVAPFDNVSDITMGDGTTLRSSVNGAVINAPIALGAVGTTTNIHASTFDGSGTTLVPFELGGVISGDADLTLSGVEATNSYGAINLNAASDYTGSTLITTVSEFAGGPPNNANIFVRLFVENALPTTTVVTLDGGDGGGGGRFCELNLNGNNQTLAGLTNVPGRTLRSQRVVNTSGTTATLTVNNTDDYTYSSQLGNSGGNNFGLTKSGAGTLTLSGTNAYVGNTNVTEGTLALVGGSQASPITVGAGAFIGFTVGSPTTSAATLDLSAGQVKISGTPTLPSYTLMTASAITGPAVLAAPVAGYELVIDGTSLMLNSTGGGTYADWLSANAPATGFLTDTDNDGTSNGVEHVLNSDPNASSSGLTEVSSSANSVTFNHTLNPDLASDVTYGYGWSTDLAEWNADGETNTGGTSATIAASVPDAQNVVTVVITITGGPANKVFGRLEAQQAP